MEPKQLTFLLFNNASQEGRRIFAVLKCEEQHLPDLARQVALEHNVEDFGHGVIPSYEQHTEIVITAERQ